MNTTRSALSSIISVDNIPVDQHPVVCRFLKGAFERKPPSKKYYGIWDVQIVLQFLKTYVPNASLTLKELSLKLAMLLALVSIQRKQTLLQLNIHQQFMKKSHEFLFILGKHVKQSRPNYPVPPVVIPRYTIDPDVCPYLCLEEYIEHTRNLRQDDVLFISFIKPRHVIGAQTLARWI
jgi:hypothetical protein